jgi:hypothetical protein
VQTTEPFAVEQLACASQPPLFVAQGPVTSGVQVVPLPV